MTIIEPRMPRPKKRWPRDHDKGTLDCLGPRQGGPGLMTNNHELPKGQDIVVWGQKHNCMGPHDKIE